MHSMVPWLALTLVQSLAEATAVRRVLAPHEIGGNHEVAITQHYFDAPVKQGFNTNLKDAGLGRGDRSGLSC